MVIDNNSVVSIHYELTDDDGAKIDSSAGQEPLIYLHGANNIISGLESALVGKDAGDKLQVTVQPGEGYGVINETLIQVVPKEAFEGVKDLQPGMQLQAEDKQGHVQHVTVKAIGDEGVTIDANHPLAGKVLHFDVAIEAVREATEQEKDHGHVHIHGHDH